MQKVQGSISIIVPTYNRPEYLSSALESIARQDQDLIGQIHVGDDSSAEMQERNAEVISRSDVAPLVKHWRNDPPLGGYPNQWSLAERVHTPYVVVLHDDDELCDDALATLVGFAANESPGVDVWFGSNELIDNLGRTDLRGSSALDEAYGRGMHVQTKPLWEWALTHALPPDGFLITTAAYCAHMRGDDGNVGDWGLLVRLANAGLNATYVAQPVSRYRVHPVSNTGIDGVDVHKKYELALTLSVPASASPRKQALLRRYALVAARRYIEGSNRAAAIECYRSVPLRDRIGRSGLRTLAALAMPVLLRGRREVSHEANRTT